MNRHHRPERDREPGTRPNDGRLHRRKLSDLPKEFCTVVRYDIATGAEEERFTVNPNREDAKAQIARFVVAAIRSHKVIEIFSTNDEKMLDAYDAAD